MPKPPRKDSADQRPLDTRGLFISMERDLRPKPEGSTRKAEAAQQLVYEAMTAEFAEDEAQMVDPALELDPENIDALLMSLRRKKLGAEAEAAELRRIVALAEKQLGAETFTEGARMFWGLVETRPYMRTRAALGDVLWRASRFDEAVAEWEGMLKLNPNDNQAFRYRLMTAYLVLSRPD